MQAEALQRRLWAVAFTVAMVTTVVLGCVTIAALCLPLLGAAAVLNVASPALGRTLRRAAGGVGNGILTSWLLTAAYLTEQCFGMACMATAVVPKGCGEAPAMADLTPPPRGKVTVYLMNHRTRLDWMLFWAFLARTKGVLGSLRIALKGEMARIPFMGWAMQYARFLFLSRNKEDDLAHIRRVVRYVTEHDEAVTLLVFPEGTDLSPSNVEKAHAFAEKSGKPKYDNVLLPRTVGTTTLLDALGDRLHEVVDVTMAYTDFRFGDRPGEKHVLSGEMPRAVHFLLTRYAARPAKERGPKVFALPQDQAAWIHASFDRREGILAAFYAAQRRAVAELPMMRAREKSFDESGGAAEEERWVRLKTVDPYKAEGLAVPWLWLLGCSYGLLTAAPLVLAACALCAVVHVAVTKRFGGVDRWLVWPYATPAA